MPRHIIKLTNDNTHIDYYLEWSTIVDAPVTYGMSLDEFKNYYREEYGRNGMDELERRLARVEKNGTSSHYDKLEDLFRYNLAGLNEKTMTKKEIIQKYCIEKSA